MCMNLVSLNSMRAMILIDKDCMHKNAGKPIRAPLLTLPSTCTIYMCESRPPVVLTVCSCNSHSSVENTSVPQYSMHVFPSTAGCGWMAAFLSSQVHLLDKCKCRSEASFQIYNTLLFGTNAYRGRCRH